MSRPPGGDAEFAAEHGNLLGLYSDQVTGNNASFWLQQMLSFLVTRLRNRSLSMCCRLSICECVLTLLAAPGHLAWLIELAEAEQPVSGGCADQHLRMAGETAEVQTEAPRSICLCKQPSAVNKGLHYLSQWVCTQVSSH